MFHPPNPQSSRRMFIKWSSYSSMALFACIKFCNLCVGEKPGKESGKKNQKTVKMLTQEGKLVEVNVSDLGCGKRKMISDEELKGWVKPM